MAGLSDGASLAIMLSSTCTVVFIRRSPHLCEVKAVYGHPSPHILGVVPAAEMVLAHHTPQADPVRKTPYHTLWGEGIIGSSGCTQLRVYLTCTDNVQLWEN